MFGIRSSFLALAVALAPISVPAMAEDSADAAIRDMQTALGFVPSFVDKFPRAGLAGAWEELKSLQFSDATALSGKEKELIGLAVAAQIPCQYCVWLHTKSAYLAGATDQEVQEAVAMAGLTRHWSTILNGNQVDFEAFKSEFDKIAKAADEMRAKTMAAK